MRSDSARTSHERWAGAAGLVSMGLTAVLSIWLAQAPRPLAAAAADDRFAAGRAMVDVRELSRVPRPIGSAAHAAARGYLLGRMAELGLEPEVHEATVAERARGDAIVVARVRNLVGRLRGSGGGGATLLVAHYDSRPNTPGAGDDAAWSDPAVVAEDAQDANGAAKGTVVYVHALRNALVPVLTIMGLQLGQLLAGAIIIENVFYLPGLGRLVFQAIGHRDLPVVREVVLFMAAAVVVVNFIVDLAYAYVDPRIQLK